MSSRTNKVQPSDIRRRSGLSDEETSTLSSGPAVQVFPVAPSQFEITFQPGNVVAQNPWNNIRDTLSVSSRPKCPMVAWNKPEIPEIDWRIFDTVHCHSPLPGVPEDCEPNFQVQDYSDDSFESDEESEEDPDDRIVMGHAITEIVKTVADGSALANSFFNKLILDVQATVNDVLSERDSEDLEGDINISDEEDDEPPLMENLDGNIQLSPVKVLSSVHEYTEDFDKQPSVLRIVDRDYDGPLDTPAAVKTMVEKALDSAKRTALNNQTGRTTTMVDWLEQDGMEEEEEYFRILRNYIKTKNHIGVQACSPASRKASRDMHTATETFNSDACVGDSTVSALLSATKGVQTERHAVADCGSMIGSATVSYRNQLQVYIPRFDKINSISHNLQGLNLDASSMQLCRLSPLLPLITPRDSPMDQKTEKVLPIDTLPPAKHQLAKLPQPSLPAANAYRFKRSRSKRPIPLPDRVHPLDIDLTRWRLAKLPTPASVLLSLAASEGREAEESEWDVLPAKRSEVSEWVTVKDSMETKETDKDWFLM